MYLGVVNQLKTSITRYSIEIARYKMILSHHKSILVNLHRRELLHSQYDWRIDGIYIYAVQYKLQRMIFYQIIYTCQCHTCQRKISTDTY